MNDERENKNDGSSCSSRRGKPKLKYKRYSKFKKEWKLEQQDSEVAALRAVRLDGKLEAPVRDYLALIVRKGETVTTSKSENIYDLMGCCACQTQVLREAYKAKNTSLGQKGIASRNVMLKRTEESWASGRVRCQHDKISTHERSGMHNFCYPR